MAYHHLKASVANCHWGYFDATRAPVLTVKSGDHVTVDTVSGSPAVVPSSDFYVPPELLEICAEVILVRRRGSHYRRDTPLPDVVEEFDSEAYRACLKQTISRWKPDVVQLEFTQMAQYAPDCSPARTVLVEHDITFDLQQIEKGGYEHFMLKEIHEQPESIRNALRGRLLVNEGTASSRPRSA